MNPEVHPPNLTKEEVIELAIAQNHLDELA
jgi:hypothetical protein